MSDPFIPFEEIHPRGEGDGRFNLPYEEVGGEPMSMADVTDDPVMVDNMTLRGGLGYAQLPDGRRMAVGIGLFTFWSSMAPDIKFEMSFTGDAGTLRAVADNVRNGLRHVANQLDGLTGKTPRR